MLDGIGISKTEGRGRFDLWELKNYKGGQMAKQIFEVNEGSLNECLLLEILLRFPGIKYKCTFMGTGESNRRCEYVLRGNKKLLNKFFVSWVGCNVERMSEKALDEFFRFIFKLRNQSS